MGIKCVKITLESIICDHAVASNMGLHFLKRRIYTIQAVNGSRDSVLSRSI